jgi:hypothetical protein
VPRPSESRAARAAERGIGLQKPEELLWLVFQRENGGRLAELSVERIERRSIQSATPVLISAASCK